ncbi:hypothetical protein IP88_08855 [alpha proteobacterium AAP81b]|nr:hypothetical protein IP88_08855 [alpha proteobacterium AAP81b]
MQPGSALAIYLLFWMLTLFVVLPFGVRTPEEIGDEKGAERVPGAPESAPHNPMILRKFAWTTAISAALFGLFWANYVNGWVALEDIPGWENAGPYRPMR